MNLRAETKAMINLNHPAIVRVFDFHESGAVKYIDMELIEGKNLSQLKTESPDRKLPEALVLQYARQIADGMSHAHAKNIIHRDIKPQNVIVSNEGLVKILDFGIAQTLRTSMSRLVNTSSTGTLVYMSPEQIRGQDVGKESDIYSFGAMVYELLSGKPPFWQGALEHQILNEQPKVIPGVTDETMRMVLRCLEKDYTRRFRSFGEVFLVGGTVAERQPVVKMVPPPVPEAVDITPMPSMQIVKKKGMSLMAIGGIIIGVLVVAFVMIMVMRKSGDIRQVIAADSSNMPPIEGMVWIEGGTFMMGSNDGESNEKPVHQVTVSGFYMSKYEVTQAEYEQVMGNNPSKFTDCPTCPVENVSWHDAVAYCEKVGKRLPTEAEWEYACRAGSTGKYYWGDAMDGSYAWYSDNSGGKTHPVGQKLPNAGGLYDMSGNVWEWCSDWYDENYYSSSPAQNPLGASGGSSRVLRGGSWDDFIDFYRSAGRNYYGPDYRDGYGGFRVVLPR